MRHVKLFEGKKFDDPKDYEWDFGLFCWNSSANQKRKNEIVKWFKNLSKEEQKYVEDIRQEGYADGFDSCAEQYSDGDY